MRSMWEWARDLDQQELLWCEFAIYPGSPEDIAIQLTEGWILDRQSRFVRLSRCDNRRATIRLEGRMPHQIDEAK